MNNSVDRRLSVNGLGAFQSKIDLMVELLLDVVLVRLSSIKYVT